jgi:hypothetical protein
LLVKIVRKIFYPTEQQQNFEGTARYNSVIPIFSYGTNLPWQMTGEYLHKVSTTVSREIPSKENSKHFTK